MKRLLLLFCVIFASVTIGPAWSADGKKPKKSSPTVLVKKTKKAAPKMVKTPPVKPPASSVAVLPDAKGTVALTKTDSLPPIPWQVIDMEQPSVTTVVISPATPMATSLPTNPYLMDVPDTPKIASVTYGNPYLQSAIHMDQAPLPSTWLPDTSPFSNLKSAALLILPDGIGRMHLPLYVKYIKQPETEYSAGQKPILLFEVSCPTKALFGFDTPVVYVLQLGVDQIIELTNSAGILPIELQKVCN
ncbi:MAG: hypothetical protein KBD19_04620 [Candidatus Moranbacteria bacterium]|nr:hypothetical protein [Candidatus Moranbacteria bacterium]